MICVLNLWKTSLRRCSLRRTTLRRRSVVNLRAWARLRLSPKGRGRRVTTRLQARGSGPTSCCPSRMPRAPGPPTKQAGATARARQPSAATVDYSKFNNLDISDDDEANENEL